MIANAAMRQVPSAVTSLVHGAPQSPKPSGRDEGYVLTRRRDGCLQVEIDMAATPWPYNAWQWAAMLPDVWQAMLAALTGCAEPVVVALGRQHSPRRIDVLLWLRAGQIRVENRRAAVEHQVQFAATALRDEANLTRIAAALVEVVLRVPAGSVSVTSRVLSAERVRGRHTTR